MPISFDDFMIAISQIRRLIRASETYNTRTSEQVVSALAEIGEIVQNRPELLDLDAQMFPEPIEEFLILELWDGRTEDRSRVVQRTLDFTTRLRQVVAEYRRSPLSDKRYEKEALIVLAKLDVQMSNLASTIEALSFREEAQELAGVARLAAREASEAADNANNSAGIAADADLSIHFGEYADSQLKTARNFRVATIAVIAVAIVAAAVIPHLPDEETIDYIYRGAQVLALAGLSGYLGRQAGQHRRIGNWARAMQVQLKSFAAFIAPIDNEVTLAAVYDDFSKRVLGAMPEKPESANTKNDPSTTQLLDIVTALIKKA